ncbi:general substrate transporter [Cryphonectria parasitica EP155]|uniref:General substrate transporter n=1 Tax=Cryphonectria parasitica (strain ATCC 38755 / EP155) TaxID=660469 RepID=A0A9P4XXM6_CRYP1|nr:general substrate transporter [Cryphonectria parasitica EP155]KAF3762655.1 general substrate transporter [Cryphonectria parasitica EP155]
MAVFSPLKQSKPIRPPKNIDPSHTRPPNLRYVYSLTAFVSLGGFLFGWNQGAMGMIIADKRWIALMQPSSDWAVGFVISVYNISCALGALFVGNLADVYGRERTLSVASVITILGALVQAASNTLEQMTLGRFVIGLGIGAFAAGVPLYVSEISPASLRGRIVGIELMILCFAEMVVFFVDYACFFLPSDSWWRIPLFIQVFPAVLMAVGCWRSSWVPPSPRWLVAQGRYDCALEVLTRLHGTEAAEVEMREIRETVSEEQADEALAGAAWADMFRPPVLRVTLLGAGVQFLQQITGTNAIFYYTPQLFRNGGITDPNIANLATSGVGVVLFLSAWIPIFFFDRLGRKTWLQLGLVGMFTALLGIALLQRHAESHPGDPRNYAIIAFPFLFFTSFNMSWSSGSWTYAAEIFPISLRAKGNALCTASLWISNFIVAQVTPPIMTSISWGLYIILAAINVLAFLFVRYFLVETRGKTLEEMAYLFGIEEKHGESQEDDRSSERRELLRDDGPADDGDDEP